MLSEKLTAQLNDQITYEFMSSHLYLSMAAYCYSIDLDGFANFFRVQVEEERFHANRFFDFIKERNKDLHVEGFEIPPSDYTSILDAFEKAYEHELSVTARIYALMDVATDEREHATISFLKWFIDEQVEEEATFKGIIQKLRRSAGNVSIIYDMDAELATRVFTPPVIA